MSELHLINILIFTGHTIFGGPGLNTSCTTPTCPVSSTVAAWGGPEKVGTYCQYQGGVLIYEPSITVACPKVYKDKAGNIHVVPTPVPTP